MKNKIKTYMLTAHYNFSIFKTFSSNYFLFDKNQLQTSILKRKFCDKVWRETRVISALHAFLKLNAFSGKKQVTRSGTYNLSLPKLRSSDILLLIIISRQHPQICIYLK